VRLDRETGGGVPRVEGMVYKGTGSGSSRYRQKNEDGGGRIGLYNRRCTVNGVQRWVVEASGIFVQIVE